MPLAKGTGPDTIGANIAELIRAGHAPAQAAAIAYKVARGEDSAAGICYRSGDSVLLLLRSPTAGDYPLTWCFPGGGLEPEETPEQAAIRESQEEVGYAPADALTVLDYDGGFTTFALGLPERFTPTLNEEHIGFVWAPLANLPQPLHPGVAATLAKVQGGLFAFDADQWITVHPNGGESTGSHVLIGEGGEVKAGMGGKFTGKHISEAKGGGGKAEAGGRHPSVKEGHHELSEHQEIVRETEKAVAVKNHAMEEARNTAKYDVKELSSEQIRMLQSGQGNLKWLPKSQVSTHEGKVTGAAPWLAQREGFSTREGSAAKEKAFEAGKQRYSDLLSKAKAAGVPGVRERMKTSTIKEKMRAHGMQVDSMDEAEEEGLDYMAQVEGYAEDKREYDGNGWFEIKANPISKAGVFPYSGAQLRLTGDDAGRIFQVFRPPEELADPECIESFKLLPWVDDHTMIGPVAMEAAPDRALPAERKGVQGVTGEEVFFKDGTLYANIKAFSSTLAALIEAGKRELSAGYRCKYFPEAGEWMGQPYQFVQRVIRGNHLALVQEGRMGPDVAVMDCFTFSFDAKDIIIMDGTGANEGGGAGSMTLEQVVQVVSELAPQVAKLTEAFAALSPAQAAPAAGGEGGEGEDKTPPAPPAQAAPAAGGEGGEGAPAGANTMDAAEIERSLVANFARRDKLAAQISQHIGTFDHASMTLSAVVAYGCDKLGVKAAKGHEAAALDGFLQAKSAATPSATVAGMDAAPVASKGNFVDKHLMKGNKP